MCLQVGVGIWYLYLYTADSYIPALVLSIRNGLNSGFVVVEFFSECFLVFFSVYSMFKRW